MLIARQQEKGLKGRMLKRSLRIPSLKFFKDFIKILSNFFQTFCKPYPAISRGFLRPFLVAQRSKRPNIDFGCTLVKSTIWSHTVGQKDRFVISGRGAPKKGKTSWRKTFGTIGIKVRSLYRLRFRKFDSWSHLKTDPKF